MKAILFDFGGVFVSSPFAAVDDVANELKIPKELLHNIIFGQYHEDNAHPWHQLERGEISLEQCREAILSLGRLQNLDIDIYQVFARFADIERQNNDVLITQLLQWKQAGIKLAIVTNNIKEFDHWRDMFPFAVHEVFDVIADSCQLGLRKPNQAIFEYTLKRLGVDACDAIFVDDYRSNVEAAEKAGIAAFCLTAMDEVTVQSFIDWVAVH
ncbi:MAG: HAD family phosphatase [Pseudomonadales bacterium]|nr:HAD family phosphatase [Pseudomonadales bacterium]